jgi:hypothetical protein
LYGTVIYSTQEFADVDSTHCGFDGQYLFFILEGDTLNSYEDFHKGARKLFIETAVQNQGHIQLSRSDVPATTVPFFLLYLTINSQLFCHEFPEKSKKSITRSDLF